MIIGSAPQLLDNPCCDFINQLPWGFFLLVHAALFAVGAYMAWRALSANDPLVGTGFLLFAVAEVVYATYHVNVTQFLFAHTVAEVLDGLAFVLLFAVVAGRHRLAGKPVSAVRSEPVSIGR